MNKQIKQRLQQINNGQVPEGYKKTDFGIFPCDWETDMAFGDLFTFCGGLGKSREELSDNGIEYLHYGDMHRADFNKVSLEQYSKLSKYDTELKGDEPFLMQDGDVAFLDASEDLEGTSRAVLIDNPDNEPFIAGLHIILGKPTETELAKNYKQYLTSPEYVKKQFQKLASGFKVYGLNRKTLAKIKYAYPPSADEQNKIAEILMKWDEAIELYQRQIENLEKQKKVYLSKMFPKKCENVPEYRFKGFDEAWEQRKLGDVYQNIGNAFVGTATPYYVENGHFYLESNNVKDGQINRNSEIFINDEFYERQKDKWLHTGDMVMVQSGHIGHSAVIPEKLNNLAAHALIMFRNPKIKINPYFLNYEYQTVKAKKKIENITTGNTIKHILASDMQEFIVDVPSFEEQQQIGLYFANLDNLITLHQRKVEKVKEQRKVLQQYLLNGIVRVEL